MMGPPTRAEPGWGIMRARWWEEPVIVILTLWALIVIAPDLSRVFGDFPKLGFEADNDGKIFHVAARAKDKLDGCTTIDIEKTDRTNRLAIFGGMAGMQYVRPNVEVEFYAVCSRDGKQATELIRLSPEVEKTTLLRRLLLLAQELVGLYFIWVGATLVLRRRSEASWGFFLFSIWFNPGQNYVLYAELQAWPDVLLAQEGIQAILQAAGYMGLIVFALKFPRETPERGQFERIAYYVGGAAAFLQLVFQLWSFATAFGYRTEIPTRISFLIGYGIELLVIALFARKFGVLSGEDRAKLKWVFVGCLVGLPAYILADIYASTSMLARWWQPPEELTSLLYLANGLLAYAVYIAVWRNHVVDVKYIVGRRLILIVTWILISALLVVFVAVPVERLLEESWRSEGREGMPDAVITVSRYLAYVAGLVVLKIVMDWSIEKLNAGFDSLFFCERNIARKEIRLLMKSLEAKDRSLDWIDEQLIHSTARHLSLTWAGIFRPDHDLKFQCGQHYCDESEAVEIPCPSGLLIEHFGREPTWKRIAGSPEMVEGQAEDTIVASLAIPIFLEGRLYAIVLYGLHTGGDDIDASERLLLIDLVHAATRAYHRVEFVLLRSRIAQLEAQVSQLRA
jgi:hypothetical protein